MLRSVALVGLCGCSLLVTHAAPETPPPPPAVACHANVIAPIVDTVVTLASLAAFTYFATGDHSNAELGASLGAGLAIGFGVSSVIGWRRTAACHALHAAR